MSTPGPSEDINQWILFCEALTPYQNVLLLGAISKSRYTTLAIFQTQPIETQDNWKAAEDWMLKHLRKGLRLYCDNYQKTQVTIGAEGAKRSVELVKVLAPFLMLQLSIPLGAGVAFLFWALGFGLHKWCEKYSAMKLGGEGEYSGNIPQGEVKPFFDITYLTPIVEFIENEEAYPLEIEKKQIRNPAETSGLVKVPSARDVEAIAFGFSKESKDHFSFQDAKTNKLVGGDVTNVYRKPREEANMLSLIAGELSIT
jgi:hypothetical protein